MVRGGCIGRVDAPFALAGLPVGCLPHGATVDAMAFGMPEPGGRISWLGFTHKLETMDRMIPIGPTGRDMIAQGKARNERRPGYSPGVVPSPVRARQRLSRACSAEARVVRCPGPRSPLASFDLGYHVPARWASGQAKLVGKAQLPGPLTLTQPAASQGQRCRSPALLGRDSAARFSRPSRRVDILSARQPLFRTGNMPILLCGDSS